MKICALLVLASALTTAAAQSCTNVPNSPQNVTCSPYNAIGNGIADDTIAIQKAINAAAGTYGGSVYIPAGVYYASNLSVPSFVTIYGDGAGKSIIRARVGGTDSYFIATSEYLAPGSNSANTGIILRDLTIDGNEDKASALAWRAYSSHIVRCNVLGGVDEDMLLATSGQDGTTLTGSMANDTIEGSVFGSLQHPAQWNIYSVDPTYAATDFIVRGNWFTGAAAANVDVRVWAGWIFANNHLYGLPDLAHDSAVIRRGDFASNVSNNYFESSVEITDNQQGLGQMVFGPGNTVQGNLLASFGNDGTTIVSQANIYSGVYSGYGQIVNNYNGPGHVLVSMGDSFKATSIVAWNGGTSNPNRITFVGSYWIPSAKPLTETIYSGQTP